MRKLVFIIVNYNDFATTKVLLNNIKDYKIIDKIYVVDNHSSDDSYSLLKKLKINRYEVIETVENKGFAYALNVGAKKAIEDFSKVDIIFSNADIIINSEEDLKILKNTLDKKEVGVVGPIINQHGEISRGWSLPKPKDEILANLPAIGKKITTNYKNNHYKNNISFVDAVSFCFFLIKSETIEEVKFFDENTFLYYEENIMCSKIKNTKYRVCVDNTVTIIHNHSVSVDKNISYINKFKILKKSQIYFEKTYNKVTWLQLFLLKLTSRVTLLTLYVRIFLRGGFGK